MNESLRRRCELFAENMQMLKKITGFRGVTAPLCAALCTEREAVLDPARIKTCRRLFRTHAAELGRPEPDFVSLSAVFLALSEDPEGAMAGLRTVYAMLRASLPDDLHLLAVAEVIVHVCDPSSYERVAARAKTLCAMAESAEAGGGHAPVAMLSLHHMPNARMLEQSEICRVRLVEILGEVEEVAALSCLFLLGEEEVEVKCERFRVLMDELARMGYAAETTAVLPLLGAVALHSIDSAEVALSLREVVAFLEEKRLIARGRDHTALCLAAALLLLNQTYYKEKEPITNRKNLLCDVLSSAIAIRTTPGMVKKTTLPEL